MEELLNKLRRGFPQINFIAGDRFSWSPAKSQVIYNAATDKEDQFNIWSLLHELGHGLLGHNTYDSDFELLSLEAQAWYKAQEIAKDYSHTIDPEHIQDCLDTYRDWLYQRSTCPVCTSCSLQIDKKTYCCFNCGSTWQVSSSRLCRPYRRKQKEILV